MEVSPSLIPRLSAGDVGWYVVGLGLAVGLEQVVSLVQ